MRSRAPLRLSVVVCAHDVEGFLAECVESLLAQDCDDFEIVAVDDCSADSSGAVLDDLAARDAEAPGHPSGGERGPRAGSERRRGARPWRLRAVSRRGRHDDPGRTAAPSPTGWRSAGDPDVLLYDYERTFWWGEKKRNRLSRLLSQAGPAAVRARRQPGSPPHLPGRLEQGLPPGLPERGRSAVRPGLLRGHLLDHDRPAAGENDRHPGPGLRALPPAPLRRDPADHRTSRHIEVIDQYATVFSHLSGTPQLYGRWAPVVHRQLVNHLLSIWEHPRRLPADYRSDFFAVASRRSRELCPTPAFDYSGDRRQAVKQWLLLHGHRRTLVTLQWGARVIRRARQGGRRLRRALDPTDALTSRAGPPALLPLATHPPHRPAASGLLGVLERRLPVQSSCRLREGRRARSRDQGRLGHPVPRVPRPQRDADRPAGLPCLLEGAGEGALRGQQRQLPRRDREAPGDDASPDPARDTPEVHGDRPAWAAGGQRWDEPGQPAASIRPLGLQPVRQSVLVPESGARAFPCDYEMLELGYPQERPAGDRDGRRHRRDATPGRDPAHGLDQWRGGDQRDSDLVRPDPPRVRQCLRLTP